MAVRMEYGWGWDWRSPQNGSGDVHSDEAGAGGSEPMDVDMDMDEVEIPAPSQNVFEESLVGPTSTHAVDVEAQEIVEDLSASVPVCSESTKDSEEQHVRRASYIEACHVY